ncbi:MAG: hypothetical protein JSW02_04175 [candidate division WOR-3 bacterium]|nr:MAG: hypothetical protein JSW02_04175 [candidate division WOR-3 bacterium]
MKYVHIILALLIAAGLFADTITLKSGLTIKGEVISVESDTVTIQTKTGELKIPTADVEEIIIEEEGEERKEVPEIKEERVLSEQAIPKSIKQVGCGCLGGIVGGSAAGILAVGTDGFGDSENLATIVILGSVIIGVLIGFVAGGG